jgi:putative ABC transport system permease protein
MSTWRPALRIARRTVLRSPARSLLIALLVALPVAGAGTLDVLVRTMTSPEHRVERQIGSADAVVTGMTAAQLSRRAPTGTAIAASPQSYGVFLEHGRRATRTRLVTADVREPLHRHMAVVDDGLAPGNDREVLVTRTLARRLDLLDGEGRLRGTPTITLRRGPTATVSGIARAPFCLSCAEIIAAPGSQLAQAVAGRSGVISEYIDGVTGSERGGPPPLLVDLPDGTSHPEFAAIVRAPGVDVVARDRIAHPPAPFSLGPDVASKLRAAALVTVMVGLGLLEIVLLAGTAFAVGARRGVRELGLVAASGGSPRDVRRVVLAQGLVLGALGALAGVIGAIAFALAGRPLWERFYDEQLTSWAFSFWELGGIVLTGLLAGLAAAAVPAIGAGRMRPVNALAGRFREGGTRRRRSALAGGGMAVAGVVLGIAGDRVFAGELRRSTAIGYGEHASSNAGVALIVAGGTLAVLGLVLLAPVLIGALARIGGRLPLSARLAVRDAERHRHRTGPATGAITIAVAGAVVTAFLVAMVFRADESSIFRMLPADVIAIKAQNRALPVSRLVASADGAVAELPGGRRHIVRVTGGRDAPHLVESAERCPARDAGIPCFETPGSTRPAIVDPASASAIVAAGGALDRAARDALAAGEVVVFDAAMLDRAGRVIVQTGPRSQRLPGHLMNRDKQYASLPSGLVSANLARSQGWSSTVSQVLVTFDSGASDDDVDTAMATATDGPLVVTVESRDQVEQNTILLITGLIAGLVTLFGVAISVALSAAEGRADLATLAAVGAPPGRRRALVAFQALVVGGLGGLLGVALGTFVAYTARSTTGSPDFVVPWWNLVAAGLGAPLVAALVAALCTRGRLPLVRRAE